MPAVLRHEGVDALEAAAGDFLLAREAEHNLILGICSGLRDATYDGGEAYLASIHSGDGGPVAVAVRTPPHDLVLSCTADASVVRYVAEGMARHLSPVDDRLPGVQGPVEVSAAFAGLWSERMGVTTEVARRMRIHRATRARVPSDVPGALREAREGDRGLLARWGTAFEREAGGDVIDEERAQAWAERLVRSGTSGHVLWEVDGVPVSLAGYGGPTPNGMRVSAVYTPPGTAGEGLRRRVRLHPHRTTPRGASVLLPLHRPREPDVEPPVRPDRVRAGGGHRRPPLPVRVISPDASASGSNVGSRAARRGRRLRTRVRRTVRWREPSRTSRCAPATRCGTERSAPVSSRSRPPRRG